MGEKKVASAFTTSWIQGHADDSAASGRAARRLSFEKEKRSAIEKEAWWREEGSVAVVFIISPTTWTRSPVAERRERVLAF